jgi:hypothetical protein
VFSYSPSKKFSFRLSRYMASSHVGRKSDRRRNRGGTAGLRRARAHRRAHMGK